MAKRRDGQTRAMKAYEKEATRLDGERYVSLVRGNRTLMSVWGNEGRSRGRRGVRARARQARINARQANGTYTQPGGGNTTNS